MCIDDHRIIVGGGFEDPMKTFSSNVENNVSHLRANHEEADTRILLHVNDACNQGYARLVIECTDTDVLLLLLVLQSTKPRKLDEIWYHQETMFRQSS